MEVINELTVVLKTEYILRGQGIDPAKASPLLIRIASGVIDEAGTLIRPAAVCNSRPVLESKHEQIIFKGGVFAGPLVARAFTGATSLVLALCTIGPKLERRVDELMTADPLRAMALDGAGTAAVEEVSRQIKELIISRGEKNGLKAGMKAGPGQEGWPIEQQRLLFGLLPASQIGVRLTESCLMIPRKTISFVVGYGGEMCTAAVSCDFCSKRKRCQWRK